MSEVGWFLWDVIKAFLPRLSVVDLHILIGMLQVEHKKRREQVQELMEVLDAK